MMLLWDCQNQQYKFQNSSASNLLTIDNSGNGVFSGNINAVNVVASGTGSFSSLVNDTTVYNGSLNTSFKIQGNTALVRLECQTDASYHIWDSSNNHIYHFSSDKQVWFENSVNSTSLYYTNGIPVSSSKKLKRNIKEIDSDIFYKLNFKHYEKNIMNEWHNEFGLIADDVKDLDKENKYNLWIEKENKDGEIINYLHYNKIFSIACNEVQRLRNEINELKNKLK